MFKIILLLCSVVINSNACSVHNAVNVYQGPEHSTMYDGKCDAHAQALADRASKLVDHKQFYVNWECVPMDDDRGS